MGKPEDDFPAPSPGVVLGESANSISLARTGPQPPAQQYFDDDPAELEVDDLPPLYTDHDRDETVPINPLLPADHSGVQVNPFSADKKTDTAYYIDRRLESDAQFLEEQLTQLSHIPPRPYVHIRGTHKETFKKGDRSERKDVVDFDVEIELTHLLYEDVRTQRAWRSLEVVGNFEKVRRGTIFSTRAPGFGGGGGAAENGTPDLAQWCWRYTSSTAGLKAFAFERRVTGWDFDLVKDKIESLVRATNYRGHTSITFPVHNARLEVYNDCFTNRSRLTKWIEMLCVFTLLFLLTWPWLFLRTKRWETVYAEWRMSRIDEDGRRRYVSMSEDRWYNTWGRAIQKAILERRQGTLDQGDLGRAEGAPAASTEDLASVLRLGIEAMGAVNRQFGWGGDR